MKTDKENPPLKISMESLVPPSVVTKLRELASIASRDPRAELEVKVLAGDIQTKDVANRIVKAIEDMTSGGPIEEHRATFSYSDGLRVNVFGPENIHKVCTTGSFRGVPLTVERKRKYFDVPGTSAGQLGDVIDVPDLRLRVTLRHEEPLRKDFSGSPMDSANHVRILHRKSWKTTDGLLRIDMSLVKSKTKQHKVFTDILRQTPIYEVEVEVIDKKADVKVVMASIFRHVEAIVAAFQQSPFILTESDMQRYRMEFDAMKVPFLSPVTLERQHLRADRPNNILAGYTVTNKADGERAFLVVMRDKRLIRVYKDGRVAWTGITAIKDNHIGDVIDGEFLSDRNLFCIFDVYAFRGKNTMRLPLMIKDEDVALTSRLGCAHQFIGDLVKDFKTTVSKTPMRIETKMFLAGDGPMMEAAIQKILDTQFEYPIDGLVFTPRASAVGPVTDRKGSTWLRVYKWKPADQNSIDFLVRYKSGESFDPVTQSRVFKGTVYIGRNPGSDVVYPCETITGEYAPPELPEDLKRLAEVRDYVPSPFQPLAPRSPDAYTILLPLNPRGFPVDKAGERIEDNTIIECARDVENGRWIVMRTRYDKTYQYRVLNKPQYGNDVVTADSIWTNIHNPVTEEMIRAVSSSPPDDTFEDELYYRDALESRDRVLRDVYSFHNKVKEGLYLSNIKPGDTLLELAVGRGGDLHKWRKTKPSKVVGIDIFVANLESPRQGMCVRYLNEIAKAPPGTLPPALFIVADMTQRIADQDNRYIKILTKQEPAPTPYLEKFVGLTEFDVISCQFAIHYACESEDTFRTFVGNLTAHGKGIFFGTCMDGQAVYALLLGKNAHTLRARSQVYGEITKQYADGEGWTEEFGKAIDVKLESFERPVREYLVPFGKVTEILRENGYELVNSTMFADHYAGQNEYTFSTEHQAFSFLHRSFVFRKTGEPPAKEEVKEPEPEPEVKVEEKEAVEEAPKKKTIKIKIKIKEPTEEPVFFSAGKEFSNEYDAKMQIDGQTFATVEHYYQWSKAKMFGDADAEKKILKTASAKSVKTYGKKVTGFKEEEWDAKKNSIVRTALKAKFTQHPDLRKMLLDTGTKPLAFADPRDKYWSIGTSDDTSKAKDPSKWSGKNMLGKLLTELRTELATS